MIFTTNFYFLTNSPKPPNPFTTKIYLLNMTKIICWGSLNLENLWFYLWVAVAWRFNFTTQINFSPCYRLGRNGKLLKCLRILITVVYFKDQECICKTVYCISSFVVCKIAFCSEFPNIPDSDGRKTRRRSRTKAIPKRYALQANEMKLQRCLFNASSLEIIWFSMIKSEFIYY